VRENVEAPCAWLETQDVMAGVIGQERDAFVVEADAIGERYFGLAD
jgi:hypothetical protein